MRRWLVRAGAVAVSMTLATAGFVLGAGPAAADPSANAWYQLRRCESSNRYTINTGNGHYGAYQFDLATWKSVGGTGLPSAAPPAEQDYRALVLYRLRGWQPWTCAALIGLHEDADARSKVIPPPPASFTVPYQYPGTGTVTAPAWQGSTYSVGGAAAALKTWQLQAASLGYPLIATGFFGANTRTVALAIQARAGIGATGVVDQATWNAAWTLADPGPGTDPDVVYTPQTRTSCHVGAATAPAWPGSVLTYGLTSRAVQCFQWQLAHDGYDLSGTAYFGTVTLAAVTNLQQRNSITTEHDSAGRAAVGPLTWAAAWRPVA